MLYGVMWAPLGNSCRWYDAVIAAADDIAVIMTAECGKPLAESKGEIVNG